MRRAQNDTRTKPLETVSSQPIQEVCLWLATPDNKGVCFKRWPGVLDCADESPRFPHLFLQLAEWTDGMYWCTGQSRQLYQDLGGSESSHTLSHELLLASADCSVAAAASGCVDWLAPPPALRAPPANLSGVTASTQLHQDGYA